MMLSLVSQWSKCKKMRAHKFFLYALCPLIFVPIYTYYQNTTCVGDITVRAPVPVEKRIAVALYKLSSAAEYRTVGNLFGISCASVHNFLKL